MKDSFAELFKKYRLRSQYHTVASFSDALAESGFSYDPSMLSHWQSGAREPKDRELLLTMLEIFIAAEGVTELSDAQVFLESTGQGSITVSEQQRLFKLETKVLNQAPRKLHHFIQRDVLTAIMDLPLHGATIIVQGGSGVGKTSLATELSHRLVGQFPDGVIWLQLQGTSLSEALNHIGNSLGHSVTSIQSTALKAASIRALLSKKTALIVLDSAEKMQELETLLPSVTHSTVLITTTQQILPGRHDVKRFQLEVFSVEESLQLSRAVLGDEYVVAQQDRLLAIFEKVGSHPLLVNLLTAQLSQSIGIDELLQYFDGETLDLSQFSYDGKTLDRAISVSIEQLSPDSQLLLKNISVFASQDFTVAAAHVASGSSANSISCKYTLELLVQHSLLTATSHDRYRLHPLIYRYVQQFSIDREKIYRRVSEYYSSFLQGQVNTVSARDTVARDVPTLLEIITSCNKLGLYSSALQVWMQLSIFLWDTGRWEVLDIYGDTMVRHALTIGDTESAALLLIRERGWLHFWRGKYRESEKYLEEGLRLADELNSKYLRAYALQRRAVLQTKLGELDHAKKNLDESQKIFRSLEAQQHFVDGLTYEGHVLREQGLHAEAESRYRQVQKKSLEIGDEKAHAIASSYLGNVLFLLGKYDQSLQEHTKGLELNKKIGSIVGLLVYELAAAKISLARNNTVQTKTHLGQARIYAEQLEAKDFLEEIKQLEIQL